MCKLSPEITDVGWSSDYAPTSSAILLGYLHIICI